MRLKPQAAGQPRSHVPGRTNKASSHDRTDKEDISMAIYLAVLLILGLVGVICASLLA